MALVAQIITAAESDVILAAYPDWTALTEEQKDAHLFDASQYLANNYVCPGVDYADPPQEIDYAVAYFGYEVFKGTLYAASGTQQAKRVESESAAAGSVNQSKTYGSGGAEIAKGLVDNANDVLRGVCYLASKNNVVDLVRA